VIALPHDEVVSMATELGGLFVYPRRGPGDDRVASMAFRGFVMLKRGLSVSAICSLIWNQERSVWMADGAAAALLARRVSS
jgi:hypothetical protein